MNAAPSLLRPAHEALESLRDGYADRSFAILMQLIYDVVFVEPAQWEATFRSVQSLLAGDPEVSAASLSQMIQFELAERQLSRPPAKRAQPWFSCNAAKGPFAWPSIGAGRL
jgi:hypothetical protein